jgi:hypothetical protein
MQGTPRQEVFADLGRLVPGLVSHVDGKPPVRMPRSPRNRAWPYPIGH